MAAYLSALPLFGFFWNQWALRWKIPIVALKVYTVLGLIIVSLTMAVNLNIYREWGTKIPYRAVSMLFEHPVEAIASASSSPFLVPFVLFLTEFVIGIFLFWRFLNKAPLKLPVLPWFSKLSLQVALVALTFFILRSGLQTTPLNPSMAYFSTTPILNHAAVNTQWNLLSDLLHSSKSSKNPYQYMEEKEALSLIIPYLQSGKSEIKLFKQDKPNVVLLVLESFTADLVEGLGGEKGITPHFEELLSKGLVFSNAYASSDRTDKGMIAVMSGFPSQAHQSIIKNVNKLEKLPAIGQQFQQAGYHTSFFHGGESAFYNIKSYMLSHGIEKVIDKQEFPVKQVRSKWGAFDHLTFQKQLDYLSKSPEPFFSTLLTLSNHEPFDLPTPPKFGGNSLPNLFRSSAFYTDSALHDFLTEASLHPWYENTVFVIIADHGHRLPKEQWQSPHPNRYRIPFLFYGPALKEEFQGQRIEKITGQTDLAKTLLNQLDLDSSPYFWSRDVLSDQALPFSFFTWNNGFGVITPDQSVGFETTGNRRAFCQNENASEKSKQALEEVGKAYLQEVYNQFLKY